MQPCSPRAEAYSLQIIARDARHFNGSVARSYEVDGESAAHRLRKLGVAQEGGSQKGSGDAKGGSSPITAPESGPSTTMPVVPDPSGAPIEGGADRRRAIVIRSGDARVDRQLGANR